MTTLVHRSFLSIALVFAMTAPARAEGVLDHVPDDALGFAMIRNLEATNDKIERVFEIFQEVSPAPLPAPLAALKSATGLGAGLNDRGDAILALLAGADDPMSPRPLLVFPVSDYAAFAGSVKGDASGEISLVTIAGEEVLAARRGSFAVLMNVEHRDRLEALLAAEPKQPAAIAPLQDWLSKTDAAAVIMPTGVDMLAEAGKQGLAGQRAMMDQAADDPQTAQMLKQMQASMEMYEGVLGFLGAEIEAAGFGLSIDDATNLRLTERVVLSQKGQLANIKPVAPLAESPFAAYADEPFVGAFGGPLPPEWLDALSKVGRNFIEKYPELYGFEDLKAEDWKDVEESWKESLAGWKSMSMIMLPGEKGDALFSNFFSVMGVENAKTYLKSARQAMEKWNELTARSTSDIKMKYDMSDVTIAGKGGMLMELDVAAAVADPNVQMMQPLMETIFGKGGKLRMYYIAASDTRIVSGLASEEQLAKLVEEVAEGESNLAKSESVQHTIKLLDPQSPWQGLVSPQGCVTWFTRIMNTMMAQFGGGAPAVPEFPKTPPIGFSMNLADGQFSGEMVLPVETLKGLAAFIKDVNENFAP